MLKERLQTAMMARSHHESRTRVENRRLNQKLSLLKDLMCSLCQLQLRNINLKHDTKARLPLFLYH